MRVRIAIAGAVIGTAAGITIGRTVRWWRTWGYDPLEETKALPGDDLVPTPKGIITRGITIDAPPEAVWPWLVQMGYGRAGWYSYDRMDMRGESATTIVPGWQKLEIGDVMPVSPDGGFVVRVAEPGRALVLFTDTTVVASQAAAASEARSEVPAGLAASGAILSQIPQDFAASWAFALEPLDGGRTRLIERFRIRVGAAGPGFRVAGPFIGFGVFVMMQRQMLGLRERAMRTAVAPPIVAPPVVAPPRPKSNGRAPEATAPTEVVVAAT
jgi:hypothetical protein